MARARLIARSLSTSERRARLHVEAKPLAEFCQALYPLLVAHADDFGRLEGSVFHVKHAIEPTSPRSLEHFAAALSALHSVGLITWYEVDGRKYIEVNDFKRHQPGLKVRGDSTCPAPAAECRDLPPFAAESTALPGNPPLSYSNLSEQNLSEKGTEQKVPRNAAAPDALRARFELFWDAYPKKTGKDDALKAWNKRKPSEELLSHMLQTLEWQCRSADWTKEFGKYVPNPATWLNRGQWTDQPRDGPIGLSDTARHNFQASDEAGRLIEEAEARRK